MKILVTGGCGFVGSNLSIALKRLNPAYEIVAFDNLTRRGSELNVAPLAEHGIRFIHGDIRSLGDLEMTPECEVIIDAAAEPSVQAGLQGNPQYVIDTNLNGTLNCLQLANKRRARFIFLSTSRVYPIELLNAIALSEGETRFELADNQHLEGLSRQGLAESFSTKGPKSFYGASKLASEMFIQEYHEFLGSEMIINRCGVIAGPRQMGKVDQGVVVLWMARHFWKKELTYLGFGGTGKQVRDLLHVDDLVTLIDHQLKHFDHLNGKTFNVGGSLTSNASLQELTSLCQEITGNKTVVKAGTEDRLADIPWYITDNSTVNHATGWTPLKNTRDILSDIFEWMKENEKVLKPFLG